MTPLVANLLAACLATCLAEVLTLPADTLKTRMQLWGNGVTFLGAIRRMIKESGYWAFFAGLDVAVLRQATYGTLKYGSYPTIERTIQASLGETGASSLLVKIISALLAGTFSSAICNPTDLLKTRKQGNSIKSTSLIQGFVHIAKTEGIAALWLTGLVPNVLRGAVIAAAELATYDTCMPLLAVYIASESWRIIVSALLASICSAILSCPFDTIKSRMMNQQITLKDNKYANTVDCFRKTIRSGGILDLWSGLLAYFIRLGPNTILIFFLMDKMQKLVSFFFPH
jgi:hypothetical protein